MFDNVFDAITAQRIGGPLDEPHRRSRRRPAASTSFTPRRGHTDPEV